LSSCFEDLQINRIIILKMDLTVIGWEGVDCTYFRIGHVLHSGKHFNEPPDPLLLRKSGSAGNQTQDFWVCSQEL
jgi:hypothetical protein